MLHRFPWPDAKSKFWSAYEALLDVSYFFFLTANSRKSIMV